MANTGWSAVAALVGANLFWAGNYIVGQAAVTDIAPLSLVFLRWLIALVPLFLIAQTVERPDWRVVLRAWPRLAWLSVCGLLGYNAFLYTALQHTDALNASLINAFNPALISLAALVFLRERLDRAGLVGLGLALAGVLYVISDGHPAALLKTGFGRGDLLMVGAITVWTVYTLSGRRPLPVPPITSTFAQAVVTTVLAGLWVAGTGGATWPSGSQSWSALLFIAVFPSVGSYLLWNYALRRLPAGRGGVFLNLITVFTALFTILAGRPFSLAQLLGGAVIVVGVVLTNLRAFRPAGGPAPD
ncbi:MAG: DMT family transporter [Propionibacteriaceae bacterium]|jgi:drug/metabolite transporter (DMT)-like permease|nr:DMT family transporter [Propionibacteriaceae bacterium]